MKRPRAVALFRWLLAIALLAAAGFAVFQLVLLYAFPKVTVTHVIEGPVIQAFYATGTLLPDREYPIKSNAPGYLTQVLVDKGDRVSKDQPLAVVIEDSVQQKSDQAKADLDLKTQLADEKTSPLLREFDQRLAGAEELLAIARREQQRVSEALANRASSQSDLDRALDRVRTLLTETEGIKSLRAAKKLELERDRQVAQAALKIAQWNIDRQTIRSPIGNAVVLDRPQSVGTRLAVNDRIMLIADVRPESLVMRAAVDEENKTQVRLGQLVHMTLYAFPARVFQGNVRKIYDKADPDRRTFEVDLVMLENNPAFAAGMTGELAFLADQKEKAIVIPSQAVQDGQVWLVRQNRLAKADVRLGLRSVERTEVISGLGPDDLVLISPVNDMAPGQRVCPAFLDPAEAAALNKPKQQGSPFRGFN